jgi:D-beta-D-heptose 7-phosphate kinase / D-beta-D-heptose 1-phosphate adenosyltransferase
MIAVVGDIMVDRYIYGSSTRMSPECLTAPVIKEYSKETYVGGAGNTALNIKYLGGVAKLYCAVAINSVLLSMLDDEQLPFYSTINSNQDVIKTRIYSNGLYLARLDSDNDIVTNESKLLTVLIDSCPSLLVLSDYSKGTIKDPKTIIDIANSKNIKVLVDPKKDLNEYKGCYVLKPNAKEFIEWCGLEAPSDSTEAINMLSKKLLLDAVEKLEIENLIVTVGDLGCILATKNKEIKLFKALPVTALDVTGAGDSFLAGLAVSLNEGKDIQKAIEFATKVAGIAVTKKGTSYVNRNEI